MPQRAILRAASIATHSSQSKPYAIRNLLSLLKMQPNIRKRNIGNFTNFSNLATLASFLRARTAQLQTAR